MVIKCILPTLKVNEDGCEEGEKMRFGPLEIGLILLLVLIIFGVGKLPDVGAALGKGIREFNKAKSGEDVEAKAKSAKSSEETEKKKEG